MQCHSRQESWRQRTDFWRLRSLVTLHSWGFTTVLTVSLSAQDSGRLVEIWPMQLWSCNHYRNVRCARDEWPPSRSVEVGGKVRQAGKWQSLRAQRLVACWRGQSHRSWTAFAIRQAVFTSHLLITLILHHTFIVSVQAQNSPFPQIFSTIVC